MKDVSEFRSFLLTAVAGTSNPITALLTKPLFPLGQVISTPAALKTMRATNVEPLSLLCRHIAGDWGNLDQHDKQLNDLAVKDGSRIFSAYHIGPKLRIWLITEADRSSTTVLLPDDY